MSSVSQGIFSIIIGVSPSRDQEVKYKAHKSWLVVQRNDTWRDVVADMRGALTYSNNDCSLFGTLPKIIQWACVTKLALVMRGHSAIVVPTKSAAFELAMRDMKTKLSLYYIDLLVNRCTDSNARLIVYHFDRLARKWRKVTPYVYLNEPELQRRIESFSVVDALASI